MPRITKIYTRTGDLGTTSLGSRERVAKDALRVSAYGDVDELNSVIGVALAMDLAPAVADPLRKIQNDLFHLGSDLAFAIDSEFEVPRIEARHVETLEALIDEMSATVGPLENFILPGGRIGAGQLHLARTVCRRAERAVVSLGREEDVNEYILIYLNRERARPANNTV
ncbi:MAG: cob(I)yrinic acid a,c-diamide adenosyltransferase, partial [Candidatus Promineifilaceae bacterium]